MKTIKVLHLPAEGEASMIEVENTLAALYDKIGCQLIEMVSIPPLGVSLILDEEGKLFNRPLNEAATAFLSLVKSRDYIAGDALVVALEPTADGELQGLDPQMGEDLLSILRKSFSGSSDDEDIDEAEIEQILTEIEQSWEVEDDDYSA